MLSMQQSQGSRRLTKVLALHAEIKRKKKTTAFQVRHVKLFLCEMENIGKDFSNICTDAPPVFKDMLCNLSELGHVDVFLRFAFWNLVLLLQNMCLKLCSGSAWYVGQVGMPCLHGRWSQFRARAPPVAEVLLKFSSAQVMHSLYAETFLASICGGADITSHSAVAKTSMFFCWVLWLGNSFRNKYRSNKAQITSHCGQPHFLNISTFAIRHAAFVCGDAVSGSCPVRSLDSKGALWTGKKQCPTSFGGTLFVGVALQSHDGQQWHLALWVCWKSLNKRETNPDKRMVCLDWSFLEMGPKRHVVHSAGTQCWRNRGLQLFELDCKDLIPVQCIEFFAGVGSIATAFSQGCAVQAFDTERSETHDMNRVSGILLALWSIWSLVAGGLAHFGIVCKSFCWINSGTHRRSVAFPMGRSSLQHVSEGSGLAVTTVSRFLC